MANWLNLQIVLDKTSNVLLLNALHRFANYVNVILCVNEKDVFSGGSLQTHTT